MKPILKSISDGITHTHQAIETTIRKKAEDEAASREAFMQHRAETREQIERIRDIIQNKEP